jgi:hypothetical protein
MRKPPLDPPVADTAPDATALTAYDEEHLVTYLSIGSDRAPLSIRGRPAADLVSEVRWLLAKGGWTCRFYKALPHPFAA